MKLHLPALFLLLFIRLAIFTSANCVAKSHQFYLRKNQKKNNKTKTKLKQNKTDERNPVNPAPQTARKTCRWNGIINFLINFNPEQAEITVPPAPHYLDNQGDSKAWGWKKLLISGGFKCH